MIPRQRRLLIALGVAALALAALLLVLYVLLPRLVRTGLEGAASRGLGRALRVAGPIEVSLSLTPRVTLREVTLSGPPWGSEPAMVRVGRAAVALDLASLWSGPLRIRDLELDDVRVLLEVDGEGHGSWELAPARAPAPPAPAAGPPLVLDRAALRDVALRYRPRPGSGPLELWVGSLEARRAPATGMVAIEGDGRLGGERWELSGEVGPEEALLRGERVDHALAARLGAARLEARGRLRSPLPTSELELSAEGPDLGELARAVGLGAPAAPFRLRAALGPAADGVGGHVEVALGGVEAKLDGALLAPLASGALRLSVDVRGGDAAEVGAWLGVRGAPADPFAITGSVRREEGRLHLGNVAVRLGPTALAVEGVLGAPPRFDGTDLAIRGAGSDLSSLAPRSRRWLPPGAVALAGRLRRGPEGLALEGVELRARGAVLHAEGRLGEPPELANLDLTVDASGPDLAALSWLAGRDLPPLPFAVRGRVARAGRSLALHGVEARLGKDAVALSGRVALARHLEGTELTVRAAGPSLAAAASAAGLRGAPAEPFEARGRVRVVRGGYELDAVKLSVGRVSAAVEGRVGARLRGTALRCEARGPELSALAAWGLPRALPPEPFSVAGQLRVDEAGVVWLEGVAGDVGKDHLAVDGALGALPDTSGLDAAIELSGPSVARLGRWAAVLGIEAPRRLPDVDYELRGKVRRVPAGLALREVRARAAATAARVEGVLGTGEGLAGTELSFDVEAPDASLVAGLAGTGFPRGPLGATGRVAQVEGGVRLDAVELSVGDARAAASGTLGAWPALRATALSVSASGPDLAAALGPIVHGAHLPAASFGLSGELSGTRERLEVRRLEARLGESSAEGSLALKLSGRPAVDAALRAPRLDLDALLGGAEAAAPVGKASTTAPAGPARGDRVIPDRPLRLAVPDLELGLALEVGELRVSGRTVRDVALAGELRDGSLRLERVEGSTDALGRVAGRLTVAPVARGYRVGAEVRIHGLKLADPRAGAPPADAPELEAELQLTGAGESLHAIAASLDGTVHLVVGSGRISNAYARVTTDVVAGLLDALNPFRKSSAETRFECAIALATVQAGKATLAPLAARTDKVTVVGNGRVDLETEALELEWTLKPRSGGGLSVGSIANPYVRLGGTLASPKLEVKPLEAVASTGAAVATMGLTVLARGFYDRITAERNVCMSALAQGSEGAAGRR